MSGSISGRVAQLRGIAGLKARELDRLAGLGQGHTRLIETGERSQIEASTVSKLATALGASLGWLLNGEGKEPSERSIKAATEAARARYESARGGVSPSAEDSGAHPAIANAAPSGDSLPDSERRTLDRASGE